MCLCPISKAHTAFTVSQKKGVPVQNSSIRNTPFLIITFLVGSKHPSKLYKHQLYQHHIKQGSSDDTDHIIAFPHMKKYDTPDSQQLRQTVRILKKTRIAYTVDNQTEHDRHRQHIPQIYNFRGSASAFLNIIKGSARVRKVQTAATAIISRLSVIPIMMHPPFFPPCPER